MNNPNTFELTLTQLDIYYDQLNYHNNPLYNIGGYVRIGHIDEVKMAIAHRRLIENIEIFGVRIISTNDGVRQYISNNRNTELPIVDFSQEKEPNASADEWLKQLFESPFEIEDQELFKAYLLKLNKNSYRYVGFSHHLAMDGWGFANWAQQLGKNYNDPNENAVLNGEWENIVEQEKRYLLSNKYQSSKQYWLEQGFTSTKLLPSHYRFKYSEKQAIPSNRAVLPISPSEVCALNEVASKLSVGVSHLFLAMISCYFSKAYSKESLVFGLPFHNRKNHLQKKMLGVFTSVSPMLVKLGESIGFDELAKSIAKTQKSNFRHQAFPIGHLLQALEIKGKEKSLYDVGFNYLKLDSQLMFEGNYADLVYLSHNHEATPLMITIWEYGDESQTEIQFDYNFAYFQQEEINLLKERFNFLLKQLIECPEIPIEQLNIIPDDERELILAGHAINEDAGPELIQHYFESQAVLTPDKIAASDNYSQVTYRELNQMANEIAVALIARKIKPEDKVGICLERGVAMLAVVIGILKSGAAYVPLDYTYPKERLEYIVKDSAVECIFSQTKLTNINVAEESEILFVEDFLGKSQKLLGNPIVDGTDSSNLAYLIYTSGSTGMPKAVEICHSNTVALIKWAGNHFSRQELARTLVSTSLNFDLSVFEMFVPISYGCECVIVKNALELIERPQSVSLINTVPSSIKSLLVQDAIPDSTEVINLAGEKLPKELVNDLLEKNVCKKVFNLYGPSEDTTYSTVRCFAKMISEPPSIGKAIEQTKLYIVSESGQLQPWGITGELYVAGAGVARGYLNKGELNAQKFIENPFETSKYKAYKTGDLARLLPNSEVEFLGRKDEQIKVRGFRIELGEIENHLASHESIESCCVTAPEDEFGERKLIAYVVFKKQINDDAEAQSNLDVQKVCDEHLANRIPGYMKPNLYMVLDKLPLSLNGKIDRKSLPHPDTVDWQSNYVAPSNTIEKTLVEIWSGLLRLDESKLSVNANFFELGGHSLLISELIHRASRQHGFWITARDVFQSPTIELLAKVVDTSKGMPGVTVRNAKPGTSISLTSQQLRIWFVEQLRPDTNEHNISGAVLIDGEVSLDYVQATLNKLLEKHESLRIRFDHQGDMPAQYISEEMACVLEYSDLSIDDFQVSLGKSKIIAQQHGARPFKLYNESLMSTLLVKLSSDKYLFQLNIHHIIFDGWSLAIMVSDFFKIYEEIATSKNNQLSQQKVSYFDYALWQNEFLASENYRKQETFWAEYLNYTDTPLSLPFELSEEICNEAENQHSVVNVVVNNNTRNKLQQIASQHKGSLFNVLHSALSILLARISGEDELTIGVPVSGRNVPGIEETLGVFVNNLPVRSQVLLKSTFEEYLSTQIENVSNVLSNQEVSFERILELSATKKHSRKAPLFEVFFNMLNLPKMQLGNNLFNAEIEFSAEIGNKFEISFYVTDNQDSVEIKCHYNAKRFSYTKMEVFLQQYVALLEGIALDSSRQCVEYSISHQIDSKANGYIRNSNLPNAQAMQTTEWQGAVHQIFESKANQYPDDTAIEFDGISWGYKALDELSNYYAQQLVQGGINKEDVVAIMAQRTDMLVVAILAVMKSGGAFMLMSDSQPMNRLVAQLAQSKARCLITLGSEQNIATELQNYVKATGCLTLSVYPQNINQQALVNNSVCFKSFESSPDDIAYIAFTSGTEGEQKMVLGRHTSLTAYLPWMSERFEISSRDRFAMLSGLNHDPLQRDIFTPLCAGAVLCIPSVTEFNHSKLANWINTNAISILNLTPSFATAIFAIERTKSSSSLRLIFLAGEPLTRKHVELLKSTQKNTCLINLYGATETCRALSYYQVNHDYRFHGKAVSNLPIGQGVGDVQLILLNKNNQQCAVGELGEIGIRSQHLTHGYYNSAKLNSERFIINSYTNNPTDIIYLTGDLGRYLENGDVVCVGRKDNQIKVRGFRVELAEIEGCLNQYPLIEQSAVLHSSCGQDSQVEKKLVAYLVVTPGSEALFDEVSLKNYLRKSLPEYMIPYSAQLLSAMPLTKNGKLDRRQLEQMEFSFIQREITGPANDIEESLLNIWRALLDRNDICTHENFFDIGGHSLLATRLFSKIKSDFGIELNYSEFFEENSIHIIASSIHKRRLVTNVVSQSKKKQTVTI